MARSSILFPHALQLYVQLLQIREPSPSNNKLASESRRTSQVLHRKQSICHRRPAGILSAPMTVYHFNILTQLKSFAFFQNLDPSVCHVFLLQRLDRLPDHNLCMESHQDHRDPSDCLGSQDRPPSCIFAQQLLCTCFDPQPHSTNTMACGQITGAPSTRIVSSVLQNV